MVEGDDKYRSRCLELHRELGIPNSYASRGLPFHYEAAQLVIGGHDPTGRPMLMSPETAVAWKLMQEAAKSQGVDLILQFAFRGIEEQANLFRTRLAPDRSIESLLLWIAAPGYSEHHTGRALDITSPECFPVRHNDNFELFDFYLWLKAHAATFKFTLSYPPGNAYGMMYEPWHWCFNALTT